MLKHVETKAQTCLRGALALVLITSAPDPHDLKAGVEFSKEILVHCISPNETGRFEQCEEVLLLKEGTEGHRLFSKSTNRVFEAPAENLFVGRFPRRNIRDLQFVAIPSDRLWRPAREKFFGRCRIDSRRSDPEMLVITKCGEFRSETIRRNAVYELIPYSNK